LEILREKKIQKNNYSFDHNSHLGMVEGMLEGVFGHFGKRRS
jgi:hypothetical protein